MQTSSLAPSHLRHHWLSIMLLVEFLPAFLGTILLIGSVEKLDFDNSLFIPLYFVPGLSLYVAKIMVRIHGVSFKTAKKILYLNGWFAAITFAIGIFLMIDEGIRFSDGGWVLWSFLIYLTCASTISFLAAKGNYGLIQE